MKLIKPSFEIWEQSYPEDKSRIIESIYKQIERAGRTCYKSEDKITDTSCFGFVNRMIESEHYAMLEHGTVYLQFPLEDNREIIKKYELNHYSKTFMRNGYGYITTNYRVIIENDWKDDLKYLCNPTEYHEKRITVHFTCNRQVSHEFVRNRGAYGTAFAQESTRYCNYTKGKFGGELTFIQPLWTEPRSPEEYYDMANIDAEMYIALNQIEQSYFHLITNGWKPQQAATILPNALKTELIMTSFLSDWKHFFQLRAEGTTGAPHPQAKELAEPLMEEFIKRNWYERKAEI